MSEKRLVKVCYICHAELTEKDKGKFVEAEGKVVCRKHRGVEQWYAEVVKKTAV